MRFYNIKSDKTQDEIDIKIMKMSLSELRYIEEIYDQFDCVEYSDITGFECMFAILDDHLLKKVSSIYDNFGIQYKIIDISNDIFMGNKVKTRFKNQFGKNVSDDILDIITKFKEDWTTTDIVLDKILEKGIESLTEFDYSVLNKS